MADKAKQEEQQRQQKQRELEKKYASKIHTESGLTQEQVYQGIEEIQNELQKVSDEGQKKFNQHEVLKKIQSAKSKEHRYKYEIEDKQIPIDGDFINGSNVFTKSCQTCHSLEQDNSGRKTSGPGLGLIYGRRAGADFNFNYSEALTYSNYIWNTRNLFYFLQSPQKFIKGCKCQIKNGGIQDEEERADLIAFLKIYTKEFSRNLQNKAIKTYGKDYIYYDAQTEQIIENERQRRSQNK